MDNSRISKRTKSRRLSLVIPATLSVLLLALSIVLNFTMPHERVHGSLLVGSGIFALYVGTFFFIFGTALRLVEMSPKLIRYPKLIWLSTGLLFAVIRSISVHFQIPDLLYHCTLFSQESHTLLGHPLKLGELCIDVTMLVALAVLGMKYLRFYRHGRLAQNRLFVGAALFVYQFLAQLLLPAFVSIVGPVTQNSDFTIVPDKIMYFDMNSVLVLFVCFGLFCTYLLFQFGAMNTIVYFMRSNRKRAIIYMVSAFLAECVVMMLIHKTIGGIPTGFVLLFQMGMLLWCYLRIIIQKHASRFVLSLAAITYCAIFSAVIVSYTNAQKRSAQREEFVRQIFEDTDNGQSLAEMDALDRFYNNLYGAKQPVSGNDWICRSEKSFNRSYLGRYAKYTSYYSFAYFVDGKLVDQFGLYDYKLTEEDYPLRMKGDSQPSGILKRGYIHYPYKISDRETIVVSERGDLAFDGIATFSQFFIAYTLLYLLLFLFIGVFVKVPVLHKSLYNLLLWLSLVVLLVINLLACSLSLYSYVKRVDAERRELVRVKMGSVQRGFINALGNYEQVIACDTLSDARVNAQLAQLSRSFNVTVHLFDVDGRLHYSSDSKSLSSDMRVPPPVMEHFAQHFTYFFTEDFTENTSIYRIYKVITDQQGRVIGYSNVEDVKNRYVVEMRKSALITRYLHVYALMIGLSFFASWLIYYFVARAMRTVGRAMAQRSDENAPIRLGWAESEEIGRLLSEHNRLVEEVRQQAELLAKSERETAWREMAREVAHEIRNPLTPMRLKMQMLERAWQSKRPDFDQRMADTTKEILNQVDVLTEVAETFAEFAATQQSDNRAENLRELLQAYRQQLHPNLTTSYEFEMDELQDCHASVDRQMFARMLDYLIMNADHNRRDDGHLVVRIALREDSDGRYWLLTFAANDRGLDADDLNLVFTIKFAEANCGHSLCLPIVKNIVVGFLGDISLSTAPETGTQFFIRIPKL